MIFSVSSSAAARPTFGSAPAPRPFVSLLPICSLLGAALLRSACMSVLATMNSTPSRPDRTIRFTALPPPPPTPITLMRAPAALASSSSRSRSRFGSRPSSVSRGWCWLAIRSLLITWGSAPHPGSVARGDPKAPLRSLAGAPCAPNRSGGSFEVVYPSSCVHAKHRYHSDHREHMNLCVLCGLCVDRSSPSEELSKQAPKPSGNAAERAGAHRRSRRLAERIAKRVQRQPDARRERRAVDVIGQAADARRASAANWQIENLLGDLRHALENGAAAGEHDAGVEALLVAGAADL